MIEQVGRGPTGDPEGPRHEGATAPRVIVVDDHPSYAHDIATLLNAIGGIDVVAVVHDADGALEVTQEHRPDLVLMEVRLPEREGIEAIGRIRASCPEVKVAVLTASNQPTDVRDALQAGACGYLLKRSDAGELVAGIKAITAGATVVEPSLRSAVHAEEDDGNPLTAVEVHLLKLISRGLELEAIARELDVSSSTVKRQLVQIQRKLGASNRIQAVVAAASRGLL